MKATPAEISELTRHLIVRFEADLVMPESQRLSGTEHSNKCLTALLEAYAVISALRKEPQDLIEDAARYLNSVPVRRLMVSVRTKNLEHILNG